MHPVMQRLVCIKMLKGDKMKNYPLTAQNMLMNVCLEEGGVEKGKEVGGCSEHAKTQLDYL